MELTSLQKKILHKLIDKYESRRDYAAGEKSTRRTMLSVDKKQFPDYFHISDSSPRLELNGEMQELEEGGLVVLEWQKFNRGHTLQRIILHEDALPEAYRLLNRQSRRDEYESLAASFALWQEKSHGALAPFFTDILQKLHELAPLPARIKLETQADYQDLFTGLNAFFAERNQEILKRQLSVFLYNSSKRWDELEKSILWVVRNYCLKEDADLDDADILSERNIIPNPIHINISGPLVFSTPRGSVDVSAFYPDVGLSPSMIQEMNIEACSAEAIVTIENLSSFYQYVYDGPPGHLAIYLGGFHNRPRRLILTKLREFLQSKGAPPPFYHWGDMDLGGFRIWSHLCQKTGIPVQPLLMDEETYLSCLSQGQPMEESYAKKLAELLDSQAYEPFHSLIRVMLEKGRRVEQEAVNANILLN
jgi:hypothetical protein